MTGTKKLDPSRTTMLRRKFMTDMNRRVRTVKQSIRVFLVEEDALGLVPSSHLLKLNVQRRRYEFMTDPQKLEQFKKWLQEQVDQKILTVGQQPAWTNQYVHSAYKRGTLRAYLDVHRSELALGDDLFGMGREQFMMQAFAAPETTAKLQMIYTRAYDNLRGFTDAMSHSTSQHLATGLSNGWGPRKIAREMTRTMDTMTRKRGLTIARTEVIHAHAEGQLDSFDRMNIANVGVEAEWLTAGDDRVCPICASYEGKIMTIAEARGLIPFHPNCRCTWAPAVKTPKEK